MILKEKPPLRLRHEMKHMINPVDDRELSHRLSKLFRRDGHAGKTGVYQVNSLYFDTPYDKTLRKKLDGVDSREKFRIRYYNDDVSFIRLEKKIKVNGMCGKLSAQISIEQVKKILQGDAEFLLVSEEPLFLELYSKIKGQQFC